MAFWPSHSCTNQEISSSIPKQPTPSQLSKKITKPTSIIMAAKFQTSATVCLFFVQMVFNIPPSFAQSTSPQNIQTFYPFSALPSPTSAPIPLSPRPGKTSTKAAVGKAIGVTAASTLVLSGLLFFLLLRHSRRKNERKTSVAPLEPKSENFMQFHGKVKAVIVDENGLDVLYWKKLEEGENKNGFEKQYNRNTKDEKKEEKTEASDEKRIYKPNIQEIPLLREMSATSHSPVWEATDGPTKKIGSVQMSTPQPPSVLRAVDKESRPPPPALLPNGEDSMERANMEKGSLRFDGDIMEALFGYVATNRKSPNGANKPASPRGDKSGPPSQVLILDSRKSQNIAAVVNSLGVTREEIIDALLKGNGLNIDVLEKLTSIAPTSEEESEILSFDGEPTRLADAESFLYHLFNSVPSCFTRFNTMLSRSNYDLEILRIKESLHSLESACGELRTGGLFLKLLEAVLKAGNRLNAGASRGNAQAFNLTALRKLSDVRSTDGKTTLLQFVVQEVVRAEGRRCVLKRNRSFSSSLSSCSGSQSYDGSVSDDEKEKEYIILGLPVIGGLSTEFPNVKKSATMEYDLLLKTSSELALRVDEIRKMVVKCGSYGGFVREMEGFLESAELEIRVLREEQTRVMELVMKTSDYYQVGSSKDKGANLLQLFVIVHDFLGMIDQVCVDIARNMQKRTSASTVGGSTPPGSTRVFRFPKLPNNFILDNSKSSSSDSSGDNDSEVSF